MDSAPESLENVVRIFRTIEEQEAYQRAQEWAMTPYERPYLLEEIRRAFHPEEYNNPEAVLAADILICPFGS
jgi:hypothetical protein